MSYGACLAIGTNGEDSGPQPVGFDPNWSDELDSFSGEEGNMLAAFSAETENQAQVPGTYQESGLVGLDEINI